MTEQKTLLVDKIGVISHTNDPSTIRYNVNTIKETVMGEISDNLLDDSDGATAWFPAGKFLCSVSINLIDKEYTMLLVDLKNNDNAFNEFLKGLKESKQQPDIRKGAKVTWKRLKSTYDSHKDDFILAVGTHPD